MTTTSEIIKSAFREANLIPIGQTPSSDEQSEALSRLNSIIDSVMGFEAGERLKDWLVQGGPTDGVTYFWSSADWEKVRQNSRILANLSTADTIYLPANPNNGARIQVVDIGANFATYNLTLDPNSRMIEGSTSPVVLSTNGTNTTWLYRADTGNWVKLTDMAVDLTSDPVIDTELPFPRKYDDMFITMLAVRLNPRFGQGLSQLTIATLERSRGQFRAEYHQVETTKAPSGVLNLTGRGRQGR